ncbi:MAG: single-stranded-DNA-specific exonuclease RecJ [Candidatus Vogelbacteria bacterium]
MKPMRNWRMRETIFPSAHEALAVFPELLRPFLYQRGFIDESSARSFLEPDYERDLHDPFLMKDMDRAVARIKQAIETGEKIIIFGDYDADGIPGAVILTSFFNKINYSRYEVYIPDRHEEAYGLNVEAIISFAKSGAALLITVDCGVSNHAEITFANSLGVDVIVTDHHTVPEMLPPAFAILNPKRLDDEYPYKMLCGAGVAFKLVQALAREFVSPRSSGLARTVLANGWALPLTGWEKWLLDLVAIATVADMVPLTGENRALVHFGLKVLRKSPRPGLVALCRALKLHQPLITVDDIAFLIGPRLNSASRMAHGSQAYRLLTTTDPAEAEALADVLEGNNHARRASVNAVLLAVEAFVEANETKNEVLVYGDPSWSLGVLGLAASRLVEKYQRPVFLWSKNGHGEIKGSCRANGSINVVELMQTAGGADFFINFGGHINAGGFSLAGHKVAELAERLTGAYRALSVETDKDELILDAELPLTAVTAETACLLDRLGPFGLENPKPVFLFRHIPSVTAKLFGKDRTHLELTLTDGEISRRAIGFFMSPTHFGATLISGQPIDLVATLEQSYWRGRPELRLRIIDCRLTDSGV